jgi:hypothetical protein
LRTTILNPTLWLLATVVAVAGWAAICRRPAREAVRLAVWGVTRWPVLLVLGAMALAGVGSRVVVGYLSPGAYAEEVLASRFYLAERAVFRGDDRAEFERWLREEPAAADAWTLPGISSCQASALEHRPQFFTSQAHSPVLLLASVPVVRVAGGRGLYLVIVALSALGLCAAWWVLAGEFRIPRRSRESLLLATALVGWQPVLAGLRQGDAVLVAAALVVCGWGLTRRGHWAAAGGAAGLAATISLPAAACVLGLVRWPRALGAACLAGAVAAAATMTAGGPMLFVDFAGNIVASARTYASAMPNYALASRVAVDAGLPGAAVVAAAGALVLFGWWRARTVDQAFATFAVLGLLFAPVAWSQHMALALVPLAVLFTEAAALPSAGPLAAWALVAIGVSLPDPAVAILADAMPAWGATPWPVVPLVLLALWAWLAMLPPMGPARTRAPIAIVP